MKTATGISCGHCKGKHPTVAEVRVCSGIETGRKQGKQWRDDLLPDSGGLRPKQIKFLADLLAEFSLELANGLTPETITYRDGQPIISKLIDARRLKVTGQSFSLPAGTRLLAHPDKGKPRERTPTRTPKLPAVPDGHYAIPGKLLGYDKNDLYFYRVATPETGDWAGRTSVKTIVGGHPEFYLRRKEIFPVMQAIVKFGIENAGILYAHETRNCRYCNYHLTRKASRVMSIGPECAEKNGKGAEWRELDALYDHANAEDDE